MWRVGSFFIFSVLLLLHTFILRKSNGFCLWNIRTCERSLIIPRRDFATRKLTDVEDENLPEILRELNPKVDTNFSSWLEVFQEATICQLQPSDEWKEEISLIQVKKMTADDLEKESNIPIPESEHDFDERLYVIKLPMPIPTEKLSPVPQFLFLCPDELVIFGCFSRIRWNILVGNPGISKSWFQWKFIFLCYCQELYHKLRS